METIFGISNLTVLPFWLAMILAPWWRFTERLLRTPIGVLAPAVIYLALVLPLLPAVLPVVARPELSTVLALLSNPAGATIAWAHFLAFDLFVGRWIYLDARERGFSAWVTAPVLLLTLLLGPLGLLGYLAVRSGLPARLRALLSRFPAGTHSLVVLVAASLALLVVTLLLPLWDSRVVLGVSVWAKPAKFALSVAITAGTIAWFIPALPLTRGLRRSIAVVVWTLGLELVLITTQSIRGVASHFNNTTLFDTVVFAVMGTAIGLAWLGLGHITWRALRTTFDDRARGWAIRFGMLALLLGSALGGLMPRPTAAQRESLAAGTRPITVGAHTVGAPDGGPGLPMVGWSRTGGDLRIPHFVGIHGLQVLPLLAWGLTRRADKRRQRPEAKQRATRLTAISGVAYLGLVLVTLVQALRAQPLLTPDRWTWMSLAVLVVGAGLAASRTLHAQGPTPSPTPAPQAEATALAQT
jgi:hypothetical protein